MFEKAKELFNQGEFEKTLPILNELIEKNEFDLEAVLMRGVVNRKVSKLNESLEDFNKLTNLLSNEAEVFAERGITLLQMKQLDASLEDMNTAVAIEPENPYRYSSRAYIKDRMGDIEGAKLDYEKAIELDPEDEIAYNNLGLLLEKSGRKKAAVKNFEQSNKILENKYGIKIGSDEVRPYTFNSKDEANEKPKSEKKSNTKRKISWREYTQTFSDLIKNKSTRKAFIDFLKGKK